MKATSTAPTWISIDPDHGDKADTYTISITLEPNTTGENRTAVITITCNGQSISITITQKGVTEDGSTPEVPKFITSITETAIFTSDYYKLSSDYKPFKYEFGYDDKYRLKEVRISNANNPLWEKISFSYDILGEVRLTNNDGYMERCILDQSGRIATAKDGSGYNNDVKFTYDAGGYLIRMFKEEAYDNKYEWSGGNLISNYRLYDE